MRHRIVDVQSTITDLSVITSSCRVPHHRSRRARPPCWRAFLHDAPSSNQLGNQINSTRYSSLTDLCCLLATWFWRPSRSAFPRSEHLVLPRNLRSQTCYLTPAVSRLRSRGSGLLGRHSPQWSHHVESRAPETCT